MIDHDTFQSALGWRYGSEPMRRLWSEAHKRRLMRRVWLALAEAAAAAGLVPEASVGALRRTVDDIDIARAAVHEATTQHDVMAEILTWAEQIGPAGGILHLGATSADITDNVDVLRLQGGLDIVRAGLARVVTTLAARTEETADTVCLGWTHLQPAAPTTVGYRLAFALQDFVDDLAAVDDARAGLRTKGFKGAVGTSASYAALLEGHAATPADLERDACARLGLTPALVTSQVYSRKGDWRVLNALAGLAATAAQLAFDIRILQSPPFGEWSEGFAAGQVGSSAMPWKRNPINAENVDSLARQLAVLPQVAWHNAANCLLERTLDDSANRRLLLPDAFLLADEIVARTLRLIERLAVDAASVSANLARFGPFVAGERVLIAAAGLGADRQVLHERIRQHSVEAWAVVAAGGANPLPALLAGDEAITAWLTPDAVRALVADPAAHVGDAAARARQCAALARQAAERPAATVRSARLAAETTEATATILRADAPAR